MPPPVAFVLKGYPRLSETFIAQEILALERRGLDIRIVSLRHPTDPADHPVHREIEAPVDYLPEYLGDDWPRVLRAWRKARRLPGYPAARALWLRGLRRDRTRNRIRRFGQALVLAAELPAGIGRLHAHFLHTPASVARYAAAMRGLPWSCSAHAKDIWTTPAWDKAEKLADLDWLVTCTAVGREHLADLAPDPTRVMLAYHGLDLDRFPPPDPAAAGNAPAESAESHVTILSVGRAIEKKGYEDLLDALAALPAEMDWRFVHIGGGERLAALKARAAGLGIGGRIEWLGAQPQEAVLARYRTADLFVLASRIAADGDRDGLPNVLVEAQSQGLACIATRVSAIPELIRDGETGLLVPPGEPQTLAEGLARLIAQPELRARLGAAGRDRVTTAFSLEACLDPIAARFGLDRLEEPCASPSTHR
ncbi:MAG: glycosyltransferase family 4 protein [Proteobacteria bacterium]|nr:glycosyltransferase family 4 protein [Pseudomonadota bacterium]